jgi:23S rRNA pseudouridine1911/1915/1917 synthase
VTDSQWVVAPDSAGIRLDKFLAPPDRAGSRGRALSAIQRGKVILNGSETAPEDAARRLSTGDVVRLWMDRPGTSKPRRREQTPAGERLNILYADTSLVVVDKRAGLLSVPLPRRRDAPSVYELLKDEMRPQGFRPFIVHRIDRDTSGLVVFAGDADTQTRLKGQFRRREPRRIYRAIVYGHPDPPEGTWRDHLVWDRTSLIQKRTHATDPRAKEAISVYRVIETFRGAALIEVRLETGKRNQIRLQARLRGHMLVGERRYVSGPDRLRPIDFPRQALHAYRLAFRHPRDGRELAFEAPLPADMIALVGRLRRRGPGRI